MKAVGCFLEYDGRFVLLYRRAHKPDGNTWGLPSGKVEVGEREIDAIQRELFEETGYKASHSEIELLGRYDFITTSGEPLKYITYRVKLNEPHEVVIEDHAHEKAIWATVEEAAEMDNLIHGLHDLFRYVGYV